MGCPPTSDCAHEASKYLSSKKGYSSLDAGEGAEYRIVDGMCRCLCGLVIRAKELRNWADSNFTKVSKYDDNGLYIIYEERLRDGQGHIYGRDNGVFYGNDNYNWKEANKTVIYKLK